MNVLERWANTTVEFLSDIIDFTPEEITNLLNGIGLWGQEQCQIEDFEKLIFLYGNDQEIYCSDERAFIEGVGVVYIYNDINRMTKKSMISTQIIAANLCQYNDAIKSCFFLMKVINKAFDKFNIFIFKTDEGFFLGCRLYDTDIFNNCVLSSAIRTYEEYEEIVQLLAYSPYTDEFVPYYSMLVEAIGYRKIVHRDYDMEIIIKRGMKFSYLNMLSEIEKIYNINLERAKEMYYESFKINMDDKMDYDYTSIMETLKFIKSEKANTLEMLFDAEEIAQLANETEDRNEQILLLPDEVSTKHDFDDEKLKEYLNDPEFMIKMLKEQKGL